MGLLCTPNLLEIQKVGLGKSLGLGPWRTVAVDRVWLEGQLVRLKYKAANLYFPIRGGDLLVIAGSDSVLL